MHYSVKKALLRWSLYTTCSALKKMADGSKFLMDLGATGDDMRAVLETTSSKVPHHLYKEVT